MSLLSVLQSYTGALRAFMLSKSSFFHLDIRLSVYSIVALPDASRYILLRVLGGNCRLRRTRVYLRDTSKFSGYKNNMLYKQILEGQPQKVFNPIGAPALVLHPLHNEKVSHDQLLRLNNKVRSKQAVVSIHSRSHPYTLTD